MPSSFSNFDGVTLLIVIFVVIFVILVIREIFTWYWKINVRVSLLERSLETQQKIASFLAELIVESKKTREEISRNNNVTLLKDLLTKITKDEVKNDPKKIDSDMTQELIKTEE